MMQSEPKIHAGHMEVAVANLIGSDAFHEIEIKISASDLRADFNKRHGHDSKIISSLTYAVPDKLLNLAHQLVPAECGLIAVNWNKYSGCHTARWIRRAKRRKGVVVTNGTIRDFMRLGCMRIWSLKHHNNNKPVKT